MSQAERGRVFREAWIAGVKKHYPGEPKAGFVASWEETPDWERESATTVYHQVRTFVEVTDGRLTVTNGSGAQNNKIAFLDIKSAPIGAQVGSVTGTLPVSLFGPATQNQWTKGSDGLFSDKLIDDTTIWD